MGASASVMNSAAPTPEMMAFLQTLVSQQEQGAGAERTDSDKENDSRLGVIQEEGSSSEGPRPLDTKMDEGGANQRQSSNQNDAMWDDFYNEDDFQGVNGQRRNHRPDSASAQRKDIDVKIVEGSLKIDEGLHDVPEEDEDDISKTTEEGTAENGHSPQSPRGGKKKKKRLFKRVQRPMSGRRAPPTAQGGSHPELSRPDRDTHSGQLETMSETSGRGQRRLSRRKQVAPPSCAGPSVSGDPLTQKYEELQQLMVRPLVAPATTVIQTRAQLRRLQGLNQHYGVLAHQANTLPPTGSAQNRRKPPRQAFVELGGENAEEGYAALRTVQVTNHVTQRPGTAGPTRKRPSSGHPQKRPLSAGHQRNEASTGQGSRSRSRGIDQKQEKANGDHSGSTNGSARSDIHDEDENENDDKKYKYDSDDFHSDDGGKKRSGSKSPGRSPNPTEMHLKHSNNPALRKWLKQKDREHRKQKAAERKKHREERHAKQEEEKNKEELRVKGEEKYREWMKAKRKEAFQKAKEDRRRQRAEEEAQYEKQQDQDHTRALRTKQMDLLQTINAQQTSTSETTVNVTVVPQPPTSKFVYKRPVSGRVRLMKIQQERKDDAKKTEHEKRALEKKIAEDKARKMRMSYDQWLLKKREDDYAKRQEAARQRMMAKSDPELERIVPEVARRRIQNIQRGKRRLDTGLRKTNQELNVSFGGGDFGDEDGEEARGAARLQVAGSQKSLRERPASANTTGVLNPQRSRSPRRPRSANPRVDVLMDDKTEEVDKYAFKLPFPVEKGVPKYVNARQQKLFSHAVNQSSNSVVSELASSQEHNAISAEESLVVSESKTEQKADQESSDVQQDNNREETGESLDNQAPDEVKASPEEPERENTDEADGQSFFVTQEEPKSLSEEVAKQEENAGQDEEKAVTEQANENGTDTHQVAENQEEDSGGQDKTSEIPQEVSQDTPKEDCQELLKQDETAEESQKTKEEIEEPSQVQQPVPNEDDQMPQGGEEIPPSKEADAADSTAEGHPEVPGLDIPQEEEKEELKFEEEEEESLKKDDVSRSRSSMKHVSFQEEATVYEPDANDFFDDDLDFQNVNNEYDDDVEYDEAEDERGDFIETTPREEEQDDF